MQSSKSMKFHIESCQLWHRNPECSVYVLCTQFLLSIYRFTSFISIHWRCNAHEMMYWYLKWSDVTRGNFTRNRKFVSHSKSWLVIHISWNSLQILLMLQFSSAFETWSSMVILILTETNSIQFCPKLKFVFVTKLLERKRALKWTLAWITIVLVSCYL